MKQICTLLLITVFSFSETETLSAQINVQDSLALVDFYNSTKGPNWSNHTNWLTAAPVSTWVGISVSHKRVIAINLDRNKIRGKIPSSFGNLSELTTISLEQNLIHGSIPSTIGNLTKLINLNLQNNGLEDSIPSSIGNLQELTTLNLHDNKLSGNIPLTLANLSKLETLDLGINQLSGSIPSALGNLSNLVNLFLQLNQFNDTIPSSLGNLTHLGVFEMEYNQLTGNIPSSLGNLSNTLVFDVAVNKLSGTIPASLDTLHACIHILKNEFTFAGLERLVQLHGGCLFYTPQATIPVIKKGKTLSVNAGGTLSNNTYNWYKNGVLASTQTGDSAFKTTGPGNYNVQVTNSIATALTLYSDTIAITSSSETENMIGKDENAKPIIYPNPANEFINLKLDKAANTNTSVMICDMRNKILMQQKITAGALTQQYSVSNFLPGTYNLTITENGKKIREESFIVAR
jgi:hypothetical protein